jgi:ribosome-binding ATPase YchF (GTP1/OBG family)
LERLTKQARSGDKAAVAEHAWLDRVVEALQSGRPAREVPVPEAAPDAIRKLSPLTAKPVLYVVNVDEGETEAPPELLTHAEGMDAKVVVISARIEADLRELDPEEAEEMRHELGIERSGLQRLIRAAFDLLHLISFFTADTDKDAMARTLPRGGTAYEAAGRVHGDIQKGFIRAEVVPWDELIDAGGYAAARERGTLQIEGRDYVVKDGDVIHIRT